jgi:hypothetical protein
LRAAVGTPPSDFVRTTAQLTDPEQLLAALGGRARRAPDEPAPAPSAADEAPADEAGSAGSHGGDGSSAVPVERLFSEVPAGRDPHFDSPALRVFGRAYAGGEQPETTEGRRAPASLRELALVDRVTSITRWQEKPPSRQPRLVDVDSAILRLLDRAGILLVPLLARACMPGKAERTVRQKLAKLHDAGLIARGEVDVHDRGPGEGALPSAVRLTAHGFRIGQQRDVIDPDKQWRQSEVGERALSVPHDQHVIAWITALTRLLGERVVTDNWRTPRTRHGVIAPPQIGDGRNRRVLTPGELKPPAAGYAFDGAFTPAGPDDRFAELKPDATVEIRIPGQFTFDLLLELTLSAKPSHNQSKFAAYDAFLLGWWREHRRYQHLRGRPVVLFVFASEDALRANAEIADREITGRLGIIGIPQHEWYWPAREHTFFALDTVRCDASGCRSCRGRSERRLGSWSRRYARCGCSPRACVLTRPTSRRAPIRHAPGRSLGLRAFRSRDRCRVSGSPTVTPAPAWHGSRHSQESRRWGEPIPSTRPGSPHEPRWTSMIADCSPRSTEWASHRSSSSPTPRRTA